MNDNDKQIDQAAQDEANHAEMTDAAQSRFMQIPGKPSIREELTGEKPLPAPRQARNEPLVHPQPKVTDFTSVVCFVNGEFDLLVHLNSGPVKVGTFPTKEAVETAELAINQMMAEYRTKRNAWENGLSVFDEITNEHKRIVERVRPDEH